MGTELLTFLIILVIGAAIFWSIAVRNAGEWHDAVDEDRRLK